MLDVKNADTNQDPEGPLAFDRRRAERCPAGGALQAVLANGREMPWVMRLGLVNASATGLCVLNDAPLEPGARLSMRIDPVHGGWKTGVVVRCQPHADMYEIGIAYEMKRAA